MFGRKKNKEPLTKAPLEMVMQWQTSILNHICMGTDIETLKDSCRRLLLINSIFYENLIALEEGAKPLKEEYV